MKKVEAIIKPHKLDDVKDALVAVGVEGMTMTEVRGFGRQKGLTEMYRGAAFTPEFLSKIKLEVVCPDEQVEGIVAAIAKAAQSDEVGAGKIFVSPIDNAVRIRTGDTGQSALT
ncbi:MAG: P-II family nitrogen regulator [Candidatus Hydrogenedentota bacterium]